MSSWIKISRFALLSLLLAASAASLTGCPESSDDDGGNANAGDDDDDGGDIAGPTLDADDLPGVTPCPNQEILTDSSRFADFKSALSNGTFVYLDVPFDGGDPNIYKRKCGFEGFWNPAENTDEIPPAGDPITLADLLNFGNAGICTTSFNGGFNVDEGFPAAGIYRKEFRVTDAGVTFTVRVRVTVSGAAAGNRFLDEGISWPGTGDIENNLIYEVDGTGVLHDDLFSALVTAMRAPTPMAMIDIRRNLGDPVIFSALVELLCVSDS